MIGPNLSEWALKRQASFIVFLMIVAVAAGALAFTRAGPRRGPVFTVRTMIVAAAWPGATVEETLEQVTERLERTLQETHTFDAVRSYTIAGQTTIFVDLDETTAAADIPDVWYRVRRNIGDMRGTCRQGVLGPFFNDDFGDTFGIIYGFTADGFTFRELRDHAEDIRSKLLQVPDVAGDRSAGRAGRAHLHRVLEREAGRAAARTCRPSSRTLQAQNLLRPVRRAQTDSERVYLRVSAAPSTTSATSKTSTSSMGERIVRLGDIAHGAPRLRRSADSRCSASTASPPSAWRSRCATRRHPGAGRERARGDGEIRADLPVGIEPVLVADQSATVDFAINDFMTSLWQAIAIILVCSFVSLGVRPGAGGRAGDPDHAGASCSR
jgi:multidrug efflux pump subunit AcrB